MGCQLSAVSSSSRLCTVHSLWGASRNRAGLCAGAERASGCSCCWPGLWTDCRAVQRWWCSQLLWCTAPLHPAWLTHWCRQGLAWGAVSAGSTVAGYNSVVQQAMPLVLVHGRGVCSSGLPGPAWVQLRAV